MNTSSLLMLAIFILGAASLVGFFKTKKEGFGRFTTSVLLILLVLIFSSLMYVSGKLEVAVMANVIFSVLGFAGGLFTSKNGE